MSAVRTRKKYLKFRDGEIIHERRGEMGRSSAYIHTGQAISLLFPRIKNRKCLRLSRRSFRIRGAERRFVAVIAAGMNAGRAQFGNVGTNTTRDGNGDDVGVAFLLLLRRHRKRRLAVGTVPAGLWTDGRTTHAMRVSRALLTLSGSKCWRWNSLRAQNGEGRERGGRGAGRGHDKHILFIYRERETSRSRSLARSLPLLMRSHRHLIKSAAVA